MMVGSRHSRLWVVIGLLALGLISVSAGVVRMWSSDASTLVSGVDTAIRSRDWPRAGALLDQLARLRSPTPADLMMRAEVENSSGRGQAALRVLSEVPDSHPLGSKARFFCGQIERKRDRMRAAEAHYLDALRLDPKLIQARRELIFLYGMQSRRRELNDQFERLAETHPLDYHDLFVWTASLQDIWINPTVRSDLERYVRADPTDRMSRLALAEVYVKAGELGAAESLLAVLPATDADGLAVRARIALARSQADIARKILANGPQRHAGLARLRGQLALGSNELEAAVKNFRLAAELDPASLEAAQGLQLALQRSGDLVGAEAHRDRVRRLRTLSTLLEKAHSPESRPDPLLPKQLAKACLSVGRVSEARGWYRVALREDPFDEDSQAALHRLRIGGR